MQIYSSYTYIDPTFTINEEGLCIRTEEGMINLKFDDGQLKSIMDLIGSYLQDRGK